MAETRRHFLDAGRMLSRAFPKLDATTVAARECPRGVHTSLPTSKPARFSTKVSSRRPSGNHEFLLRAGAFTRQPLTTICLRLGRMMKSPTRKLSPDIQKNESPFRFGATSLMPRFPRTALNIGERSSSMVLVAFLGSRLSFAPRKLLRRKKMPRSVGEGKIRKRAGTTPPLAAARCRRAGRSRPLATENEPKQISVSDQFEIST